MLPDDEVGTKRLGDAMLDYAQLLANLKQSLQIVGVPAAVEPGEPFTAALSHDIGPFPFTDVIDAKTILPALLSAVPIDLQSQLIPKVEIGWIVKRDGVATTSEEGYLAPGGVDKLALDLILLPKFVPLSLEEPDPVVVEVSASIRITLTVPSLSGAAPQTLVEGPFEAGPARTVLPSIAFPWVLVLTQDPSFGGAALVLVPRDSYVNCVETLKTLLAPIQRALSTLSKVARLAAMLAGIDAIARILNSPHVAFAKGDSFKDLNDIDLYGGTLNDIEAEDELAAFVYLAPTRRKAREDAKKLVNTVTMFNDGNFKGGSLEVGTGLSLVALCRTLYSSEPEVYPTKEDPLIDLPSGPSITFPKTASTYGDKLSSIRFNLPSS